MTTTKFDVTKQENQHNKKTEHYLRIAKLLLNDIPNAIEFKNDEHKQQSYNKKLKDSDIKNFAELLEQFHQNIINKIPEDITNTDNQTNRVLHAIKQLMDELTVNVQEKRFFQRTYFNSDLKEHKRVIIGEFLANLPELIKQCHVNNQFELNSLSECINKKYEPNILSKQLEEFRKHIHIKLEARDRKLRAAHQNRRGIESTSELEKKAKIEGRLQFTKTMTPLVDTDIEKLLNNRGFTVNGISPKKESPNIDTAVYTVPLLSTFIDEAIQSTINFTNKKKPDETIITRCLVLIPDSVEDKPPYEKTKNQIEQGTLQSHWAYLEVMHNHENPPHIKWMRLNIPKKLSNEQQEFVNNELNKIRTNNKTILDSKEDQTNRKNRTVGDPVGENSKQLSIPLDAVRPGRRTSTNPGILIVENPAQISTNNLSGGYIAISNLINSVRNEPSKNIDKTDYFLSVTPSLNNDYETILKNLHDNVLKELKATELHSQIPKYDERGSLLSNDSAQFSSETNIIILAQLIGFCINRLEAKQSLPFSYEGEGPGRNEKDIHIDKLPQESGIAIVNLIKKAYEKAKNATLPPIELFQSTPYELTKTNYIGVSSSEKDKKIDEDKKRAQQIGDPNVPAAIQIRKHHKNPEQKTSIRQSESQYLREGAYEGTVNVIDAWYIQHMSSQGIIAELPGTSRVPPPRWISFKKTESTIEDYLENPPNNSCYILTGQNKLYFYNTHTKKYMPPDGELLDGLNLEDFNKKFPQNVERLAQDQLDSIKKFIKITTPTRRTRRGVPHNALLNASLKLDESSVNDSKAAVSRMRPSADLPFHIDEKNKAEDSTIGYVHGMVAAIPKAIELQLPKLIAAAKNKWSDLFQNGNDTLNFINNISLDKMIELLEEQLPALLGDNNISMTEILLGDCTSKTASCSGCTSFICACGLTPTAIHLGGSYSWIPPLPFKPPFDQASTEVNLIIRAMYEIYAKQMLQDIKKGAEALGMYLKEYPDNDSLKTLLDALNDRLIEKDNEPHYVTGLYLDALTNHKKTINVPLEMLPIPALYIKIALELATITESDPEQIRNKITSGTQDALTYINSKDVVDAQKAMISVLAFSKLPDAKYMDEVKTKREQKGDIFDQALEKMGDLITLGSKTNSIHLFGMTIVREFEVQRQKNPNTDTADIFKKAVDNACQNKLFYIDDVFFQSNLSKSATTEGLTGNVGDRIRSDFVIDTAIDQNIEIIVQILNKNDIKSDNLDTYLKQKIESINNQRNLLDTAVERVALKILKTWYPKFEEPGSLDALEYNSRIKKLNQFNNARAPESYEDILKEQIRINKTIEEGENPLSEIGNKLSSFNISKKLDGEIKTLKNNDPFKEVQINLSELGPKYSYLQTNLKKPTELNKHGFFNQTGDDKNNSSVSYSTPIRNQ